MQRGHTIILPTCRTVKNRREDRPSSFPSLFSAHSIFSPPTRRQQETAEREPLRSSAAYFLTVYYRELRGDPQLAGGLLLGGDAVRRLDERLSAANQIGPLPNGPILKWLIRR